MVDDLLNFEQNSLETDKIPAENSASTTAAGSSTEAKTAATGDVGAMYSSTGHIKLQPFEPKGVETWFWQAELKFDTLNLRSDKTKFNTIVNALPTAIVHRFSYLRTKPPDVGKQYETIKNLVIDAFSDSEHTKIKKLLREMTLGDKKPSQLLMDMRNVAANTPVNDEFLRTLWVQNLPEAVRTILAVDDTLALDAMSKMADRMCEALNNGTISTVNAIGNQTNTPPQVAQQSSQSAGVAIGDFQQLVKQVANLTTEVKRLQDNRSRERSKTPANQRTARDNSNSGEKRSFPTCWWHYKFGANAKNCKPPCNFNASGN